MRWQDLQAFERNAAEALDQVRLLACGDEAAHRFLERELACVPSCQSSMLAVQLQWGHGATDILVWHDRLTTESNGEGLVNPRHRSRSSAVLSIADGTAADRRRRRLRWISMQPATPRSGSA